MADNQLSATTNSTTQSNTQSPQTVGTTSGTAQSSSVQPGTASTLLVSQNGITLHPTALPHASLTSGTIKAPATPVPQHHHWNPVLTGLAVLLFLAAIVLFWGAGRGVKTTTE